jgi:hypothetical protein
MLLASGFVACAPADFVQQTSKVKQDLSYNKSLSNPEVSGYIRDKLIMTKHDNKYELERL